ncbi:MAG: pilus assembly protein [Gemmataceae bacterium]|nr:pilus assembly protein [Gemmataceae bacterium]
MRPAARRAPARRGAALVETALVLPVLLLFLFAVFEYGRFLLVLHATNNAARDAARYAVVNGNCPPDRVAETKAAILGYATTRMGGTHAQLRDFRVAVYPCDQAGFAESPPRVIPKSLTTGVAADPFNDADTNNPAWNAAVFTERVAVTIRGTYRPAVPTGIDLGWVNLRIFPAAIDINVTAVMGSEG